MSTSKNPPTPLRDEDLVVPLKQRKTIVTLLPHHCRWPIGDPLQQDFHFCGKGCDKGDTYCEVHKRRASNASKPRLTYYRPRALT